MDGPRDYHTKWDKSKIKRQIPHDVTYMWNLKCDTNELIYKTDSSAMVTKGERGWGGIK